MKRVRLRENDKAFSTEDAGLRELELREERDLFWRSVRAVLGADQFVVLRLVFDGQSVPEVARWCGVKETRVKSVELGALRVLRKALTINAQRLPRRRKLVSKKRISKRGKPMSEAQLRRLEKTPVPRTKKVHFP